MLKLKDILDWLKDKTEGNGVAINNLSNAVTNLNTKVSGLITTVTGETSCTIGNAPYAQDFNANVKIPIGYKAICYLYDYHYGNASGYSDVTVAASDGKIHINNRNNGGSTTITVGVRAICIKT